MRGSCWCILLLCCCFYAAGQVVDPTQLILEEVLELLEDELDEQEVIQWSAELDHLLQHPIAINYATPEDLLRIPFLTIFHVHQIMAYRRKVRKIFTVYELVHTTTLSEKELFLLQHLVSFTTTREALPDFKKMLHYGRHQVISRWQRELTARAGYSDDRREQGLSHYTGSPNRVLMKYQWSFADRIHLHLTGEKDAGEPFAAPHQPVGFDFTSFHLALNRFKRVETIIVGDYNLQFGQGLILWNGMAPRYHPDVTQVWRFGRGIRPYRGVDENRFFRGLAAQWRLHDNWTLQTFISRNRIDATMGEGGFTNLRNTGLHRTPTEIAQRRNVLKHLGGLNVRYATLKFDAGITAYTYHYNMPQLPSAQPHQVFQFVGQKGFATSADYRYIKGGFQLFGEWGWHNSQIAHVNGLQWRPTEKLSFAGLYRKMPSGFQTSYTTIFGGNTAGNYTASYIATTLQINRRSSLHAFVDWLSYPQWRFGIESPSSATRSYLQYDYERFKRYRVSIRYRNHQNERMEDFGLPTRQLMANQRHQLRVHVQHQLHKYFTLQARWEANTSGKTGTKGTAMFQEIRYAKNKHKWVLRYSVFDTEDFSSAIYTYEPDLPLGFSVPALYGEGNRVFFMYSLKINTLGEWGLRFARHKFFDRETIGSGLDETLGNTRIDIRVFARLRF